MIYFPMVTAPDCEGWNSINFFPPNEWENKIESKLNLYLLTIENSHWTSTLIEKSNKNKTLIITEDEISKITNSNKLKVFCLSSTELPNKSSTLMMPNFTSTSIPTWRSSIGIKNKTNSSSYQGEMIAFKPKSSFLTFAPFIQLHNKYIKNYFLFVNLEKITESRQSEIFFSDIKNPNIIKKRIKVINNTVNIIDLDIIEYDENSIPLLSCKDMAGLPLFVSINQKTNAISIEHTHPGASFVVHGQRWLAQNKLKDLWFKKIYLN